MNVSKSNYFVGYMFLNGEPVEFENKLLSTGKIKGIYTDDKYNSPIFDHVFYIDNADDFMCYENAYDFCNLITTMTLDIFGDKYILEDNDEESIVLISYDINTNDPQYIIIITLGLDGDIFIDVYNVNELDDDKEDPEDENCNGDCENCSFHTNDDIDGDINIMRHIIFDFI